MPELAEVLRWGCQRDLKRGRHPGGWGGETGDDGGGGGVREWQPSGPCSWKYSS